MAIRTRTCRDDGKRTTSTSPSPTALTSEGADASEDGTGRGTPLAVTGFHMTQDPISSDELAPAMGSKSIGMGVGVRRLTPTECERLQGLEDGWTAFGPDSRRYIGLGDAVTANVAQWLGERLIAHDAKEAAA